MFQNIPMAPPDPILGISDAYAADTNPNKINLSVGVYKDASGKTPVLKAVQTAQQTILANQTTMSYKPIQGDAAYAKCVQRLLLGDDHDVVNKSLAATAHTPGGTGALRVAGDYLNHNHSAATLWLSNPTWANHNAIFTAAGVETKQYEYLNKEKTDLDFDQMLESLKQIPTGDAVLLHGCCHNPTGVDPTTEQWAQIGQVLAERQIMPLVDFAYQGFGEGLLEDAQGLLTLLQTCPNMMICSSYSKNFGLYNQRTGALTVITESTDQAQAVLSQVKARIRCNYSNPPAWGGAIVSTILEDATLREQWEQELTVMRNRINGMRTLFVDTLKAQGVDQDFSFISRQNGMFSFSGLTPDQVKALRDDHAVYIVGSGRINVAGMTESNMDSLCKAIATVL